MLAYLFIIHSRVFDFFGPPQLHIPFVVGSLAMLTSLLSGGFLRAFTSRLGILYVAFTCWLLFTVPFSVWKGGSVYVLTGIWSRSVLSFVITAGLIFSYKDFHRALHTLVYAATFLALMSFVFGRTHYDRLFLFGRFGNPNDLAQLLVMVMPLLWWMLKTARFPSLRGLIAIGCSVPVVVCFFRTGSRSGLVSLAAVAVAMFFSSSSLADRLKLLLAGLCIGLVALIVVPEGLWNRYTTLLETSLDTSSEEPQSEIERKRLEDAVASTESRLYLLRRSLELIAESPIVGSGPGMFMVAEAEDAKEEGMRGRWQVSHNTFTQVASEAGLPALAIYLALLFTAFRSLGAVRKKLRNETSMTAFWPSPGMKIGAQSDFAEQSHRSISPVESVVYEEPNPHAQPIAEATFALRSSLLSFTVFTMFASFAYSPQLPVLAGLITGLKRAVESGPKQPAPDESPVRPVT